MRTSGLFVVAALVVSGRPLDAQEFAGACLEVEVSAWEWVGTPREPDPAGMERSSRFKRVPLQFSLGTGPYSDIFGAERVFEDGGPVRPLESGGRAAFPSEFWIREAGSLRLYWGDGWDWVSGLFQWEPEIGVWVGRLEEGVDEVGSGHWVLDVRLVPIECPMESGAVPRVWHPVANESGVREWVHRASVRASPG